MTKKITKIEASAPTQKTIARAVGFKATDANMKCRDLQFVLGEWQEVQGPLELCANGIHFCEYPSGPWTFYTDPTTRIFKVEAEEVLDGPREPGADYKRVARRLRLVEEITIGGDGNTGDGNTGYCNTGDRNTGYGNTGDRNTGDCNTGDRNTGDRNTGDGNTGYGNTGDGNTGDRNTGDGNTGDRNTGDRNTGDRNTGYRNTGYRNTGDRNTGDGNTGYGNTGDRNTGDGNTGYGNTGYGNTGYRNTGYCNVCDYSTGFFCSEPQTVRCFDAETSLTREQFDAKFDYYELTFALQKEAPINFAKWAHLPGITPEKLAALHAKHLAARKETP